MHLPSLRPPADGATTPSRTNPHLHTIAALLGVSVEALSTPPGAHLLHAGTSGDRWLLVRGAGEGLVVRHLANAASGDHVTDIDLVAFLARPRGGPEYETLWRLVDAALVAHLGL